MQATTPPLHLLDLPGELIAHASPYFTLSDMRAVLCTSKSLGQHYKADDIWKIFAERLQVEVWSTYTRDCRWRVRQTVMQRIKFVVELLNAHSMVGDQPLSVNISLNVVRTVNNLRYREDASEFEKACIRAADCTLSGNGLAQATCAQALELSMNQVLDVNTPNHVIRDVVRVITRYQTIALAPLGRTVVLASSRAWHIVPMLLSNGLISEEDRGQAVTNLTDTMDLGFRPISAVRALVEHGPIPQASREQAILALADMASNPLSQFNHELLSIANKLLEQGNISEDTRRTAVERTVEGLYLSSPKAHFDFLQALLDHGTIPQASRERAVHRALERMLFRALRALLLHGPIGDQVRLTVIQRAFHWEDRSLREKTIMLAMTDDLFQNFGATMLEMAAHKGDLEWLKAFLDYGPTTPFARGLAMQQAMLDYHDGYKMFLAVHRCLLERGPIDTLVVPRAVADVEHRMNQLIKLKEQEKDLIKAKALATSIEQAKEIIRDIERANERPPEDAIGGATCIIC